MSAANNPRRKPRPRPDLSSGEVVSAAGTALPVFAMGTNLEALPDDFVVIAFDRPFTTVTAHPEHWLVMGQDESVITVVTVAPLDNSQAIQLIFDGSGTPSPASVQYIGPSGPTASVKFGSVGLVMADARPMDLIITLE